MCVHVHMRAHTHKPRSRTQKIPPSIWRINCRKADSWRQLPFQMLISHNKWFKRSNGFVMGIKLTSCPLWIKSNLDSGRESNWRNRRMFTSAQVHWNLNFWSTHSTSEMATSFRKVRKGKNKSRRWGQKTQLVLAKGPYSLAFYFSTVAIQQPLGWWF